MLIHLDMKQYKKMNVYDIIYASSPCKKVLHLSSVSCTCFLLIYNTIRYSMVSFVRASCKADFKTREVCLKMIYPFRQWAMEVTFVFEVRWKKINYLIIFFWNVHRINIRRVYSIKFQISPPTIFTLEFLVIGIIIEYKQIYGGKNMWELSENIIV